MNVRNMAYVWHFFSHHSLDSFLSVTSDIFLYECMNNVCEYGDCQTLEALINDREHDVHQAFSQSPYTL